MKTERADDRVKPVDFTEPTRLGWRQRAHRLLVVFARLLGGATIGVPAVLLAVWVYFDVALVPPEVIIALVAGDFLVVWALTFSGPRLS